MVRVPESSSALVTATPAAEWTSPGPPRRGVSDRHRSLGEDPIVLLRLAYLGVTNTLAMLRLLPLTDRAKDTEILALRHQLTVLQRQAHGQPIRFTPADRAFLAARLHLLPRDALRRIRLLVRPETIQRRHRNLIARRHAAISRRAMTEFPNGSRPGALAATNRFDTHR